MQKRNKKRSLRNQVTFVSIVKALVGILLLLAGSLFVFHTDSFITFANYKSVLLRILFVNIGIFILYAIWAFYEQKKRVFDIMNVIVFTLIGILILGAGIYRPIIALREGAVKIKPYYSLRVDTRTIGRIREYYVIIDGAKYSATGKVHYDLISPDKSRSQKPLYFLKGYNIVIN